MSRAHKNGSQRNGVAEAKPGIGLDRPQAGDIPPQIIPPQSIEAEMCLLGSMILERDVIGDIVQMVDRDTCFYVPQHRILFNLLTDLYKIGSGIDLVLLRDELNRRGLTDSLGGVDFLVRLVESVPDAQNAPGYAKVVKDKSLLRDLIQITGQIQHAAYTSPESAENILDQAEKAMFEITHRREVGQADPIGLLLQDAFDHLQNADGQSMSGVSTGFTELDSKLAGLQKGELIIVAARPAMGKTSFAMNIAEHMAVVENVPVAVFSMEMSKAAVTMRLLCGRAGVDSNKFRKGFCSEQDIAQLQLAGGELERAPLYIDDTVGLTPMSLRARCRRMAQKYQIGCIFVDYLQLMREPTAESRQVEISLISGALKQVSRELNVPVVALSQLNRGVEGREGHKPRMSDLRESGSIEQDADVVMLLHRDEYYRPDDELVKGKATVIIAKQRNGPVGEVDLQFNPVLTRFRNLYAGTAPE